MNFSIIVSTIGKQSLIPLLESISRQEIDLLEVIVVNQGNEGVVKNQLDDFEDELNIRYIKDNGKGLSRGRNIGLTYAKGDFINFADDDCWYSDSVLIDVENYFLSNQSVDYLSVFVDDENGSGSIASFQNYPGRIDRKNIFTTHVEFAIFFRKRFFNNNLRYDENMGVGCPTKVQADEGLDLLFRSMKLGRIGYYLPSLTIYHPSPFEQSGKNMAYRGYHYSYARGYLTKKYKLPLNSFFYTMLKHLMGCWLYLLVGNVAKFKYYLNCGAGRFAGYFNL